MKLVRVRQNFRSKFHFLITTSPDSKYHLVIVDCVSWLEIFLDDCIDCEECWRFVRVIQSCTQRVLEQLNLEELGELQYGLRCYSDKCENIPSAHLSRCTNRNYFAFTCFEKDNQWKPMNKDDKRLYWFTGLCGNLITSLVPVAFVCIQRTLACVVYINYNYCSHV